MASAGSVPNNMSRCLVVRDARVGRGGQGKALSFEPGFAVGRTENVFTPHAIIRNRVSDGRTPLAGVIEALLTPSGRVDVAALMRFATSCDVADFCRFVRRPVLAGSSVRADMVAGPRDKKARDPNATLAFQAVARSDQEPLHDVLKHAVYPLIKAPDSSGADHIFAVGRTSGNDLVIPDLAISKRHALIQIREQGYFVRDCGSKNGSRLNGEPLGETFKPLHDGWLLAFGRYEFSFLEPRSLYRRLLGE